MPCRLHACRLLVWLPDQNVPVEPEVVNAAEGATVLGVYLNKHMGMMTRTSQTINACSLPQSTAERVVIAMVARGLDLDFKLMKYLFFML